MAVNQGLFGEFALMLVNAPAPALADIYILMLGLCAVLREEYTHVTLALLSTTSGCVAD